jgi:subtilisin family serine protease
MAVRIGIIDSGANTGHPHLEAVAGGVYIGSEIGGDFVDRIGHGTAVTAAIHEKAPNAELYAVRIFERRLRADIQVLLRAIDWCLEQRMDLINISAGTSNPDHKPALEERVSLATQQGAFIVSAVGMLPGSMAGVVGVEADPACAREACRFESGVYFASPYPRDIPGVARERNLNGVSFAVANCTGLLAALLESRSPAQALAALQATGSSSSPLSL